MRLDPLHPVQSSVVEILARKPHLKVRQLYTELKRNGDLELSLPNLYRIVARLLEEQILMKQKGRLSLNSVWITQLLDLAETIDQKYNKYGLMDWPDLCEGERREYSAESLAGLDPIWNHLLCNLADLTGEKTFFTYDAHPWYSLGMPGTESRLYQSLIAKGVQINFLYGNDTFLDKYGANAIKLVGYKPVITDNPPFLKDGYALWVIADYVLECIFPKVLVEQFAIFFAEVDCIDEFAVERFADVFRMKAKCKITLRRSKQESEILREKFLQFFG